MPRSLFFFLSIILSFSAFALDVSVEALARSEDITTEMSADEALSLNGFRQIVTRELDTIKFDSTLYWSKLDKKKMSAKAELTFLKFFFTQESIVRAETAPGAPLPLGGTLKAVLDLEKLKQSYIEITNDLEEARLKTLYLVPEIELAPGMNWEDVGVSKAQSFNDVIITSWKKNFEKEIKGVEKVVILERDLGIRPDFMNDKSVTLKWKSVLKKISNKTDGQSAQFSLSAQYILQKTIDQTSLSAFDFPVQKRTLETDNKKELSSKLASLIYNLLYSETAKINGFIDGLSNAVSVGTLELKILGKPGLMELNQLNQLLQEKLSAIKLSAQMKSVGTSESTLLLRAETTSEKIVEAIANLGERVPLNEQKILLFNRADKTFAIIPKETNN